MVSGEYLTQPRNVRGVKLAFLANSFTGVYHPLRHEVRRRFASGRQVLGAMYLTSFPLIGIAFAHLQV